MATFDGRSALLGALRGFQKQSFSPSPPYIACRNYARNKRVCMPSPLSFKYFRIAYRRLPLAGTCTSHLHPQTMSVNCSTIHPNIPPNPLACGLPAAVILLLNFSSESLPLHCIPVISPMGINSFLSLFARIISLTETTFHCVLSSLPLHGRKLSSLPLAKAHAPNSLQSITIDQHLSFSLVRLPHPP